jgi:hypothetical protein
MNIKNLLLILVLLTILFQVFSQDYDLIVTTNGDSIACRIDSITDTHIYFEMKSKKYWKHTHINRSDVIEFKYDTINKKTFVFKEGTSIIEKIKEPMPPSTSIPGTQKNAISIETTLYLALLLSYERMFPLNNLSGISVRGGCGHGIDWEGGHYFLGESTLLLGGPEHIFELGFSFYYFDLGSPELCPFARVGYRFHGYNGLLFKPALYLYLPGRLAMPALSIGFSF